MYNYQQFIRCPKCLQSVTDALRHYVSASEYVDHNMSQLPEHLKVTCIRCTFSWNEHCADHIEYGMVASGIRGVKVFNDGK